jgi:hypothetical protein
VAEKVSWKMDDVANWLKQTGLQQFILIVYFSSIYEVYFDVMKMSQLSETTKLTARDYFTWLNLQKQRRNYSQR